MQDGEDQTLSNGLIDHQLLRLIVESATDFAIFTMDPNGITTSWNSGAERLLEQRNPRNVCRRGLSA